MYIPSDDALDFSVRWWVLPVLGTHCSVQALEEEQITNHQSCSNEKAERERERERGRKGERERGRKGEREREGERERGKEREREREGKRGRERGEREREKRDEGERCVVVDLHPKLGILALISVGVEGAAAQVGLEVAEDDLVPRDHHPTRQTHEPPVLDVDSTVWI